uniref:GH18 domain-containing protein n=1 Tax=Anopheles quadriannulatus TaxID=34691 RepID=A0A182X5C0_ANOQN
MRSLTNPAGLALVVLLALSFSANVVQSYGAKTTSRVCFASVANFTANTAIGLCSHSVLHTLRVGANGTIAYVTTATTPQSTVLKLLPTYCNRRLAYPYLEPYLAVVGSGTEGPVATILSNPTIRANYIRALITFMKSYPRCVGLFIDFSNLTTSQAAGYAAFMQALFQAAGTASLKLASALPWEADRYADVYYSVTLRSLSFNVLRTYDEFYSSLTTIVRPLNPLVAMAAPFNATTKTISYNLYRWIIKGLNPSNIILGISMYGRAFTVTKVSQFGATGTASASVVSYCDALLFSTKFGLQTSSSGESISSSSSMAYVFTSFQSAELKLNFAVSNNLAGVALFSLNTAGTNAELLRYVTSIIAPTPPTGFQYPVASYPTCGVSITFPSLVAITTQPTASTAAGGGTTRAGGVTTVAPGGGSTAAGGGSTAAGGGSTAAGGGTTSAPQPAVVCGITVRSQYGGLVSSFCDSVLEINLYIQSGSACGVVV